MMFGGALSKLGRVKESETQAKNIQRVSAFVNRNTECWVRGKIISSCNLAAAKICLLTCNALGDRPKATGTGVSCMNLLQ